MASDALLLLLLLMIVHRHQYHTVLPRANSRCATHTHVFDSKRQLLYLEIQICKKQKRTPSRAATSLRVQNRWDSVDNTVVCIYLDHIPVTYDACAPGGRAFLSFWGGERAGVSPTSCLGEQGSCWVCHENSRWRS